MPRKIHLLDFFSSSVASLHFVYSSAHAHRQMTKWFSHQLFDEHRSPHKWNRIKSESLSDTTEKEGQGEKKGKMRTKKPNSNAKMKMYAHIEQAVGIIHTLIFPRTEHHNILFVCCVPSRKWCSQVEASVDQSKRARKPHWLRWRVMRENGVHHLTAQNQFPKQRMQ